MLPFVRRKRRNRRFKPSVFPPPAGLTITGVEIGSFASMLVVSFSGSIVWDGFTVPSEFKAFTNEGFLDSCIFVSTVGPDWIELEFNDSITAGAAWELQGAMAGITPAVAWPQAGTVA